MRAPLLISLLAMAGCTGGIGEAGPGGFIDASGQLPPSDRYTTDVLAADLDGDGDLDLAWANQLAPEGSPIDGGLEITINDGGGDFHAGDTSALAALGSWTFMRAVDLDGDRDLDLVLTRPAHTEAELLVLTNGGDASFRAADGAAPLVTGEQDGLVFARVAVGDVDGDSDPDLVVPVFSNDAGNDGRPDILLLNDGHGFLARDTEARMPSIPSGDDWTLGAALADFTGDGMPDLFLGQAERRQRLLVNDGAGRLTDQSDDDGTGTPRLPADPYRAAQTDAGDFDGDGDLDIAIVNDAAVTTGEPVPLQNVVLVNDGQGHFAASGLPVTDQSHDSRSIACGDVDGDGLTDIVIGNATETLSHGGTAIEILMGTADGTHRQDDPTSPMRTGGGFAPVSSLPAFDAGVFGVALGDLNGDGRLDVAAAVNEPGPDGDLSNILLLSR